MKPKLIHNWPAVKHEHDNISKIIKDTIKNFKNEQKDKKEEADYRKQFEADNLDMKDKDEVKSSIVDRKPKKSRVRIESE